MAKEDVIEVKATTSNAYKKMEIDKESIFEIERRRHSFLDVL